MKSKNKYKEEFMKYMIVILSFLLCCSCSQPKYSVCIPTVHPDSIETDMKPLVIGNYWVYEDRYFTTGKINILRFEIVSLDSVFVNVNGIKTPTLAYRESMERTLDNSSNRIYYYVKCETKTQFGYAKKSDSTYISDILNVLLERPEKMVFDSSRNNEQEIKTEIINTKFGKLPCLVIEEDIGSQIKKSYFNLGVGLMRVDFLSSSGALITQRNLIDYKINKIRKRRLI